MLPEISRRCLACGAAVRRGARFCHQCGADTEKQSVAGREQQAETDAATTLADEAPLELPEPPDTGTLVQTWEQWDESLHAREEDGRGTVAASTANAPTAAASANAEASNAEASKVEASTADKSATVVGASAPDEASAPLEAPGSRPAREVEMAAPSVRQSGALPERAEASVTESEAEERTGGVRRRPAAIVRENLRPRVEKMREASIVVMEEASEDTGLRFILIAVALFVLFLLFLLVSSFLR
ncbi:MAG TPA: zinc ribbon domain-containing protein [Pyrinomonadaceae bacterium]|nr:zinc ribbon domain-containing protein [Pyrinomonadaceae bacterium]